jgi:thiol-disulfide isomerase/thioredoxin
VLEVENAAGERVTLALGEGESALVVHFWASWCPECGEELPWLERTASGCAGDVRVVAVNVGEPADVARRFLERHGSALPLFRDPDGRVWRRLARGLPANLIWTRASRRVEVGPKDPSEWGSLLSSLGCRSMETP